MDTVANTGDEKNYVSGTADSYSLVETSPDRSVVVLGRKLPVEFNEEDHFVPGKYVVASFPPYIVISNLAFLNRFARK